MEFKTDFLTPSSGFLVGAGSVLNIGGNYFFYNYSSTPQEADGRAIRCDWHVVGQDITRAMRQSSPQQTELPFASNGR